MDKKQNLTSFQELTTTELNQITGGGLWEDLLYNINRYAHYITIRTSSSNTTIKK
ncbi:TPA: quorum-sensing system pheromone BlpC [Streptococcus pneumoniae]|nr:quorum-sensing system pheromone BlpC [Streptococcus pneumoniae]HEV1230952.1 quorum-sensing system pheromone BlpC [Streptococcus pneumoniae]HEX1962046.1 quorum-sensing system pheromone BlpC [Streptococcus pneumoniae]